MSGLRSSLRHRPRPELLTFVWVVSCLIGGTAQADGDYQLGHGLNVGPFNFGGYADVVAGIPDHDRKALALDDLSFFVTGHVSRLFNPFFEAELTDFDLTHSGSSRRTNQGNGPFVLERLYDDASLTDSVTARIGKMVAPVGEWNQIHAAPLVLTTDRPAVTYRNFSEYLTGISVLYSDPDGSSPNFQIYWQPSREFAQRPNNITFDQYKMLEGAHVSFPISLLDRIGFSLQLSKDTHGVKQSLYGLDFHHTIGKLTFEGEWTFSDLSGSATGRVRNSEWGGYLAASYALNNTWSLYSWYEGFASRISSSTAHDLLVGAAYRPHPAMAFKLEYLQNVGGYPVNPTGLFASWSILF